jgi:hypothetical protein
MMPVLDSLQAAVAEIAPKLEEKQLGLRRHAA